MLFLNVEKSKEQTFETVKWKKAWQHMPTPLLAVSHSLKPFLPARKDNAFLTIEY